ncbi:MAG: hypothetical protein J2P16_00040 [Mycobacterium sp.]|nr:hypothetical protein [Mycobacterium sp.]
MSGLPWTPQIDEKRLAEERERVVRGGGGDQLTAGELLAWLGTDAERWADAFLDAEHGRLGADDDRRGWLIGWFANAIEAGRAAAGRGDGP